MRPSSRPARRLLFLDDDPARAARFLNLHPQALWVRTVPECLERLAEPWDEIHLDHDLGGERNVSFERGDCGMAVVRRLVDQPHPHLASTRFVVHSHNLNASCVMLAHLQLLGFQAEARPFEFGSSRTAWNRWVQALRRWPRLLLGLS